LGCTAEELYGFTCPTTVGQGRYAAKDDCRAFFTCAVYTNYHPRLSKYIRTSGFFQDSAQIRLPFFALIIESQACELAVVLL
jgi:hypothetical protein